MSDQTEPAMIPSRNSLFFGELVEKPLTALQVGVNEDGYEIYACPKCGKCATLFDCDIGGAEPGCMFCPRCNQEFEG